ncbi:YnbE-like lipoprotein [Thiohalomonas denitrificans]|uniref:YnbE-like lipoprotein n=2 Tax=Thiohalomonas denitrificans TaxID=415747 RepID=A0A1G5QMQ5_9GAMM|nr:YnbE-like lipoprotein [Thiohalomonas denitrificans]
MRTLEEKMRMPVNSLWRGLWAVSLLTVSAVGCTPTVQLAPPEEPITINLNVKVQHDIRVKVDEELDEVFSEESPLF